VANEVAEQLVRQSPTNPGEERGERQAFVQQQLDDLEANIATTKAEIDEQEGALAEMFSAREIADTQAQIAALQQKLNAYQANYAQLLAFMGEGAVNTLSIVEPAVPPTGPVGPNKMRTVLLASAVGLVLALGTAFLLEYLDDTIKTPDDVERTMGVNTLAGISRIPGERLRDTLITAQRPRSPISESYRVLRTSLQFSSLDRPLRTVLVTSPSPVEGKSTTAANLAVVMAQEGRSVVLVDADLRRPVQHRIFQVGNKAGLTDVLVQDELVLDGHLQETGVDNLRLLNTGPLPPNPSELLASDRMGTLIDYLKAEADVIVFDSPPALTVTDALVLAGKADGVLLVTDAGKTRRDAAEESVERFQRTGAHLLGVVLNRFRSGRRGYYYYHYYDVGGKRRGRRPKAND
jgi:non-specific protein-tyrosine kinase